MLGEGSPSPFAVWASYLGASQMPPKPRLPHPRGLAKLESWESAPAVHFQQVDLAGQLA